MVHGDKWFVRSSSRSVDRDRRQRVAKLRRDRAELSPAGFPATLRG